MIPNLITAAVTTVANLIKPLAVYLHKVFSLNKGGMFVINSGIAFVTNKSIEHYFDVLTKDTDEKNLILPVLLEGFTFISFLIITIFDQITGVIASHKSKTFNVNKLWSTVSVKMFAFTFISVIIMFLSLYSEIRNHEILYTSMMISHIIFWLMCISYELSSFNRNIKFITGKGWKPIEAISRIASLIARKTTLSELESLKIPLTEEEKKKLAEDMDMTKEFDTK